MNMWRGQGRLSASSDCPDGLLRHRLGGGIMLWLDRSAAVVLAGFGTYALVAGLI